MRTFLEVKKPVTIAFKLPTTNSPLGGTPLIERSNGKSVNFLVTNPNSIHKKVHATQLPFFC